MLKDVPKPQDQQLQQDLQFMLSSIRARQNTLIFYLEKYKNCLHKNSTELKLAKNQFQQKDKIYTRQVTTILQKHTQFSFGNLYAVRAFWIKLKTILKVSIERISSLNIPFAERLQECYEKAVAIVQRNSDAEKSLMAYRQVQNTFKKRTIQASMFGRQALSPSVSYSESKIQKNRSETLFKQQPAITRFTLENQDSQLFTKAQTLTIASKEGMQRPQYLHGLAFIKEQTNTTSQPKIKSLNRIKNRRPDETIKANIMNFIKFQKLGKLKSTSKASEKHIRKINKHVQRCQRNFQGAFDGKYEVGTLLDKKKTIFQNIYLLYDDLFAKNIPNHKMISKFMFNTTKINQILYNAYEKKKKHNKKDNKEKQKEKQKSSNEAKQKDTVVNTIKKIKEKQKDKQVDERQKYNGSKQAKQSKKHHLQVINLNTKEKQHVRQKKESETTAMTSKHHTHHKQANHEKHDKTQKQKTQKDKSDKEKEKQKKIHRSKTAKIKHLSDIHHPHLQVINNNLVMGKHFISQQNGHKILHKGAHTEKIVKTVGS